MKVNYLKTIKGKITLSVVVFTLIFTGIISTVFYINSKKQINKNMVEVTDVNLRLVLDSLDEELKQIQSIIDWGRINSNLAELLVHEKNGTGNAKATKDFVDLFSTMVNSSTVGDSIKKVIVGGNNKQLMQMGTIYGHYTDMEICLNSDWFEPLYKANSLIFSGLVENKFKTDNSKFIIPVVRPVYSYLEKENIGFIMIAVDSDLVYYYLKKYVSYEDSDVMIFNDKGQIIAHYNQKYIGTSVEHFDEIKAKIGNGSKGSFQMKLDNRDITSVYYKSPVTGWYILQNLSEIQAKEQQFMIYRLIGITTICIATLGLILSLVLRYFINRPITNIYNKIKDISNGDFSVNESIESNDEIGKIGIGINQMSKDIVELMEQRINNEKTKKELEFKVLQTQVNPHFLYNTLNSIKWMATIQKASGIGEMSTALSRLLKNMAKNPSDEITIENEISLIKDYVVIQQYRYGESFSVIYDIEENMKQLKILKFTLQPLVENAIFHGIEPKQTKGIIEIKIWQNEEQIQIIVRDNGIGMSQDKIETVLKGHRDHVEDGLSGIGISNVSERIKMSYGKEYGLIINSVINEYTEIIINVPLNNHDNLTGGVSNV